MLMHMFTPNKNTTHVEGENDKTTWTVIYKQYYDFDNKCFIQPSAMNGRFYASTVTTAVGYVTEQNAGIFDFHSRDFDEVLQYAMIDMM